MGSRILILSASVGSGHIRAAQAVEQALRELRPDVAVRHVDVLELSNRVFRRLYGQGYFDVVARVPHLIGHLYDYLDRPLRAWQWPFDAMRFAIQRANLGGLIELLTETRWDLAINTHFLPAEIIGALRTSLHVTFPQITVTTDFDTHRLWHNSPCEHYFAATEEGKLRLAACGVPRELISAVGIPIHPAFAQHKDMLECRRRLGLSPDRPVVLQMSGGLGIGPIQQLHESLLQTSVPIQLVVVTGRNAAARQQLSVTPCPARHQRAILGFTSEMDELLAAADVVVTKPGGLTSSEALARGTPMILVDPIPGQETHNADHLLENGAAVKVNHAGVLAHKLAGLLSDPGRLRAMRASCLRIAKPRAAFDVASHAIKMLKPPRVRAEPIRPLRISRRLPALAASST
ncbi:MAG TPA: glycosyltransferase [Humisphaera sp.]|jgi:processive 1,2-diacylglycerol beta-glucosyltransferase|nr:glycosyltransferase [Humisphaera sp.]